MATRIFEIAREVGVTSKVVLTKCRDEGLEVKNHMAAVSVGLEATIREWFSEGAGEHSAVETTKHVDLKTARAEAKKTRRRSRKKTKAAQSVLKRVLDTFFDGSLEKAVATQLDGAATKPSDAELAEIEKLIRDARGKK